MPTSRCSGHSTGSCGRPSTSARRRRAASPRAYQSASTRAAAVSTGSGASGSSGVAGAYVPRSPGVTPAKAAAAPTVVSGAERRLPSGSTTTSASPTMASCRPATPRTVAMPPAQMRNRMVPASANCAAARTCSATLCQLARVSTRRCGLVSVMPWSRSTGRPVTRRGRGGPYRGPGRAGTLGSRRTRRVRHLARGPGWGWSTVRAAGGPDTGLVPPEVVPVQRGPAGAPLGTVRDGPRTEPVIATKFFVPGLGVHSVDRPRLRHALDRTLQARLTLVVAAAGWGKSTAIAQWLRDAAVPFGWLSLDAADGDVTRFWRYFLTAVQRADPRTGSALRRLEAAGADVERDVLPVLVNELADAGGQVVVVLDDYHLITEPAVHRSLVALLDRAPPCLHLVIGSRTDPPLPLSRLRVAGQLADVRADQLGFTAEEAVGLLAGTAVSEVSAQDVARLVERTEGWAAGLQLAALRLAGRRNEQARTDFIARFTGADRHVVDYLGEEVLTTLPEPLHHFLLQTSVLPRLCVPLADAVTGRADAGAMLAEIRRGNLFLTALDDEGRWFRSHQLFRDLLRLELDRAGEVPAPALHQRASRWFREQRMPLEAIEHALLAGDGPAAGELIAEAWRAEFNRGHLRTVQAWLDALPPGRVSGDPRLTVAQLWLHLDRGRLAEAGTTLAAAGSRVADDGHVQVLRALHTFKSGNVPLAAERLAVVRDRLADPFLLTVQDLVAGVCAFWLGGVAPAVARLRRAAARARDTTNRLARIYAVGLQALVAVTDDDLPTAEWRAREGRGARAAGAARRPL